VRTSAADGRQAEAGIGKTAGKPSRGGNPLAPFVKEIAGMDLGLLSTAIGESAAVGLIPIGPLDSAIVAISCGFPELAYWGFVALTGRL